MFAHLALLDNLLVIVFDFSPPTIGLVITVGDSIGGIPSEGVDVASSTFPSVKN